FLRSMFFFASHRAHRDLHSFPTRRSSDLSYTYVPLELGEYEIVLLNTNVKHSLASSAYNDRRYACEHAVSLIQKKHADVKSLREDRKSTRLNSSHVKISYAVFCLKKKKEK